MQPRQKEPRTFAWLCERELSNLHQRLLDLPIIPKTDGQKIAVPAVLSGTLVELPCGDVLGNEPNLFEVFGQCARASFGEVPLDARLFGFDEDAERDLADYKSSHPEGDDPTL